MKANILLEFAYDVQREALEVKCALLPGLQQAGVTCPYYIPGWLQGTGSVFTLPLWFQFLASASKIQ